MKIYGFLFGSLRIVAFYMANSVFNMLFDQFLIESLLLSAL
jgi:hypothetical protein